MNPNIKNTPEPGLQHSHQPIGFPGSGEYMASTHQNYFMDDPFLGNQGHAINPEERVDAQELTPAYLHPPIKQDGIYLSGHARTAVARHREDSWVLPRVQELPTLRNIQPHTVAAGAVQRGRHHLGPQHLSGRVYRSRSRQ